MSCAGGPRFFQTATLFRPTLDRYSDVTIPASGATVKVALWPVERRALVGGVGESQWVTAQGFVTSGTDVQRGDRLVIASGTVGAGRYQVLDITPAYNDRGRQNHIGMMLGSIEDG